MHYLNRIVHAYTTIHPDQSLSTVHCMRVDAVNIVLRIAGSGPPLLLLHGLGCSSQYFHVLQRLLAADFTVYAPDLPGHGRSEKPAHRMWQLSELTDWVAALVAQLELERPIIVGHSLGGGVAVDLAARYPEFVHRIVLLAPTGVPEMPPLLGQLPLLMLDGGLEPLRLFPLIVPAYLQAGLPRILRLAIDQTRYARRLTLVRIAIPPLVMRGSRDPIVTQEMMVDLKREVPSAHLVEVPGAAHALHVSHPVVVCQAIQSYVGC
jgi:pimeloyl-ACP methyl ester carboxylesterase